MFLLSSTKTKIPNVKIVRSILSTYLAKKKKEKKILSPLSVHKSRQNFPSPDIPGLESVSSHSRVQRTSNCFFIQQRTDTRPTGWRKVLGLTQNSLKPFDRKEGEGGSVKTDKNSSNRGKLSDRKFIYSRLSSVVAKSFTDIVEKCF